MPHLTIIGTGIAGIAAAVEAVAQGSRVTLIGGRPGESALFSGAWDIASDPTAHPTLPWEETASPKKGLEELVARSPFHPYTVLGKSSLEEITTLLSNAFERLSNQLLLHLKGSLDRPFLALTPAGTIKTTAYAARPQSDGNILEMKGGRLLVIGFSGIPSASFLTATLKELQRRQKNPILDEINFKEIKIKEFPPALSPFEWAKRMDEEKTIHHLLDLLISEVTPHRPTHVALPPVIGIEKTSHIFARLHEMTPIRWFETISLSPSVPGIRLQKRLEQFLQSGKVEFLPGEVIGADQERRKVTSVKIQREGGKNLSHPIDRLILATGKYLGGGIQVKSPRLAESILNLPVLLNGKHPTEGSLASGSFISSQPFAQAGLRVGPQLQPVDERGQLLLENLWAAGSLLGGYDSALQGCGMGVAVGTGTAAGRFASRT